MSQLMPLTHAAVSLLLEEVLARLAKYPNSPNAEALAAKRTRLTQVVEILDADESLLYIEDGMHSRPGKLNRLAAWALVGSVKLPAEIDKLPQMMAELKQLDFDYVGLTAWGVYEGKPLSVEDWR